MADTTRKGGAQTSGRIAPEQLRPAFPPVPIAGHPAHPPKRAPEILPDADPGDSGEADDFGAIQVLKRSVSTGPRDVPPPSPTRRPQRVPEDRGTRAAPAPRAPAARVVGAPGPGDDEVDPVFAFQRQTHVEPQPLPRVRKKVLGAPVIAPRPTAPPPIETEPPPWLESLAARHGGTSPHSVVKMRERSGFQVVHRLKFRDRWEGLAVVTFEAKPGTDEGMVALRALRDFEVRTWAGVLEQIATMPPPPLPLTGKGSPAPHRIVELPVAPPAGGSSWVYPIVEGLPGFVRPYLPWPSLADTGFTDITALEAPLHALIERLEVLASKAGVASESGEGWAGNIVEPEVVLRELARWRAGQVERGPNRITGHHFLVYAPMAAATGRDTSAPVILLPTQWRLLHRVWRNAFVVLEEPEPPRGDAEDRWAG